MVKFRGMSLDGWSRITASNSPTTSSRSKAQSGLNWIIKIQGINLLCKYLADSNMISCSCLCLMDSRAVRYLLYFLQMFVFKEYQNTEVSAVFSGSGWGMTSTTLGWSATRSSCQGWVSPSTTKTDPKQRAPREVSLSNTSAYHEIQSDFAINSGILIWSILWFSCEFTGWSKQVKFHIGSKCMSLTVTAGRFHKLGMSVFWFTYKYIPYWECMFILSLLLFNSSTLCMTSIHHCFQYLFIIMY